MANGNAGIYLALAFLGGLADSRILILELPEGDVDFISYGRREMVEEFDKRLDKGRVMHRGVEVESQATVNDKRALLEAIERIDRKFQETKEHLLQIADTGEYARR